ncbi:unnamed protein product [Musa textilis]
MNRAVALALALAAIALIIAARSPPAPIGCVGELVAASACLPHVAALSEEAQAPPAPSAACCKAVLAALLGAGGGPACLCHLIRRPGLFGFPVNASRIAALFSSCSAFGPPICVILFYVSRFCRVSRSSDVFCFLVLGTVEEARALPTLHSNTSPNLTEPGSGDAVTPPHDEPGGVSGQDIVVSRPTSASVQVPVCSLGGLLLVATVSFLLTGYICCY